MIRFLFLQIKRSFKVFPFVCAVTLALLLGLALVLNLVADKFVNSEENRKFEIALTGDTESKYIDLGLSVMRTMDKSRFSINFSQMSESEAKRALSNGDISAYVVLPEDFIENALRGENDKIKYVTSPGGGGITTMFKNEITQLVTEIVVNSQKGTYGVADAAEDAGLKKKVQRYIDQISLDYVELIFNRSEVYEVKELGIVGGLSMIEAVVCGLIVVFIMLMGIPYVIIYCGKDKTLSKLLKSRGYSILPQVLCEYTAHLISMLLLVAVIISVLALGVTVLEIMTVNDLLPIISLLIPVIFMISAFNMMIFEISDNVVSGVLLHFFITLSLCYVSGCMYPAFAFPNILRKIAQFLPTGLARDWITAYFTDEALLRCFIGLAVYMILFLFITYFVRVRKIRYARG